MEHLPPELRPAVAHRLINPPPPTICLRLCFVAAPQLAYIEHSLTSGTVCGRWRRTTPRFSLYRSVLSSVAAGVSQNKPRHRKNPDVVNKKAVRCRQMKIVPLKLIIIIIIIIIIYVFVKCHKVITSEALAAVGCVC